VTPSPIFRKKPTYESERAALNAKQQPERDALRKKWGKE
jgi:hypothetical protein